MFVMTLYAVFQINFFIFYSLVRAHCERVIYKTGYVIVYSQFYMELKTDLQPQSQVVGEHTNNIIDNDPIHQIDCQIVCLVDTREHRIASELEAMLDPDTNNNFEKATLELGDFQIVEWCDSKVLKTYVIIERKTVNDLASSLKDGRYLEQKARLLAFRQQNPSVKLAYIIEGGYSFDSSYKCGNVNNKSLSGAIINSMLRDNIYVWFTKMSTETCHLLTNLLSRYQNDAGKYAFKNRTEDICENGLQNMMVTGQIQSRKMKNLCPATCFLLQLSCIPGVSTKKAKEIMSTLTVSSMYDLCMLLDKSNCDVLRKVPGIGPKLQTTIRQYLWLGSKKHNLAC